MSHSIAYCHGLVGRSHGRLRGESSRRGRYIATILAVSDELPSIHPSPRSRRIRQRLVTLLAAMMPVMRRLASEHLALLGHPIALLVGGVNPVLPRPHSRASSQILQRLVIGTAGGSDDAVAGAQFIPRQLPVRSFGGFVAPHAAP